MDLYSPPARESEDPSVDAEEAVINTLVDGRAPAIALGAIGMLAALLFGICALALLAGERSLGGGLYFLGLAAGCAGPSWILFQKAQILRDLQVLRTQEKVVQAIRAQNRFLQVTAIVIALGVGISVLVFLFAINDRWD